MDHKPLKFMQTQGELHNHFHKNYYACLQQFHFDKNYKKGRTNHVTDYLPVVSLTIMHGSYGHESFGWPQLYDNYPKFSIFCHMLGVSKTITKFQLLDGILCHPSHHCVPSSECWELILEAHYSWVVGHFDMENTIAVLQKYLYWMNLHQDVNKYP